MTCRGACVPDCHACSGLLLACAPLRQCVAKCTQCANPIECFACDDQQENPIGSCEPSSTAYCLTGQYKYSLYGTKATHCDCGITSPPSAVQCPSAQHACIPVEDTDWCVTCGETLLPPATGTTNTLVCKNNLKCDTTSKVCK